MQCDHLPQQQMVGNDLWKLPSLRWHNMVDVYLSPKLTIPYKRRGISQQHLATCSSLRFGNCFLFPSLFFFMMFTFSNSPFHLSKYHTTKSTLYICVFSQYVKAITLSLCVLWKLAWPMEPIYQQRASLQPRIYHTVCHTICTQWAVKGNIQTHIIIGDSSDCLKPPHNSIPNSAYARAYLSPWNISFTRALLEQSILGWSEVTHEPGT